MFFIKRIWQKYISPIHIEDIFTPSSSAGLTFIKRTNVERRFHSQFRIKGRQIIVYGHSGSGKTTFLKRYFEENKIDYITVQCDSNMSFEQIVSCVFDQLNVYGINTRSVSNKLKGKGRISAGNTVVDSGIEFSHSNTETDNYTRYVSPQLNYQRLADALGNEHKLLLIEDFHKIDEEQKKKLADMMKVFTDKSNDYKDLKIVCTGAVDTAREIVKLDNNLKQRVYECEIPLLSDSEIRAIVELGCGLLNIVMADDLIDRIVHYSNQLGGLAHQLAYDVCESSNICKTQIYCKKLSGEHFYHAVENYIDARSDSLVDTYDRAIKDSLGWYVLKTFSFNPQAKLRFKQICRKVNTDDHPFSENDIALKLVELSMPEVGILRSNNNGESYSISDPFWGAFIKMRIAKEQADQEKAYNNSKNRSLLLQNQNDIESMLLKILLSKYDMKV